MAQTLMERIVEALAVRALRAEMLKVAQNQSDYQMAASLYQKSLQMLRTRIAQGRLREQTEALAERLREHVDKVLVVQALGPTPDDEPQG